MTLFRFGSDLALEIPMKTASIIVIGGSTVALSILQRIVRQFPENFPASIFVVSETYTKLAASQSLVDRRKPRLNQS